MFSRSGAVGTYICGFGGQGFALPSYDFGGAEVDVLDDTVVIEEYVWEEGQYMFYTFQEASCVKGICFGGGRSEEDFCYSLSGLMSL